LVAEIVRAFDGIEGVPLPGVFLDVRKSGAHSTLGGAGVRTSRVELGQYCGSALTRGFDSGSETSPTRPNDNCVITVIMNVHTQSFARFLAHVKLELILGVGWIL
jgi:hypothetical protein